MELTHPNIVRLHEYYKDAHTLYLVEEYCSGGTLEALIRDRAGRPMSPDNVALLLRQMLRGVLCCHAHGLTHRDLKPDNFVLASRDSAAALKLIDFGLSLWSHVPSECACDARDHPINAAPPMKPHPRNPTHGTPPTGHRHGHGRHARVLSARDVPGPR